ncbi:MAG: SCO family protein [Ottowia sp.]
MFRFTSLLISACLLACLNTGCAPQDESAAPALRGQVLDNPPYGRDFKLLDHNGQERSLQDFKGKVVVIFFGYTQCPDVCPITLLELATAKKKLGPDGEKMQGIFITVDPTRDTPDVLKVYTESFDPTFLALRPRSEQELADLIRDFKVISMREAAGPSGHYTISHSANSLVYDPQGRLRLNQTYHIGADAVAANVHALLHEGEKNNKPQG